MGYVELQVTTAFSPLRGASHAEELSAAARVLGLSGIGVTDLNTVAGVVRMHAAAHTTKIRTLVGARLSFRDGTPDVLCYPTDRAAWGRLTRLLTTGKGRVGHGDQSDAAKASNRCLLDRSDLMSHAEGQVLIVVPPDRLDDGFRAFAACMRGEVGQHAFVAATRRFRGDDGRRLRALASLPLPMLATNDVLYHAPDRRALQDVLTCVRLGRRVEQAGFALQPNAERHIKTPAEMARLFKAFPEAVERTLRVAELCRFSLDDISYEYPDEPVPPGLTADQHLADLTWAGARQQFEGGVSDKLQAQLRKELDLIEKLQYARYFLTVHDIVRFARSRGILCQGRGSAANSAVCYCLGVTAVDPEESNLLFERFLSSERREPPDIDIDFEHERREEVIQYIYQRYGRDRAGIAATVIHYRPKSAIRDVGKALGLSEDATAALSSQSWSMGETLWPDDRLREVGLDPGSPVVRRAVGLARELVGFPRHLSQHVGGFVLTRGRLDDTVPIGNAAMDERTFIEWDKDDIDLLRIMKVDVLALGMLTCIRKAFDLLGLKDMKQAPREDPAVYAMLSRGDSIGVFQVESRAQMNMLPRLRPKTFYDLVIEVAIVRPGPIQGDMVHPYLRRRQGLESYSLPGPSLQHGEANELALVLEKTLGVPLFQEQAMRIAIDAAKFTSEEANQLRRAMATFRNVGTIHEFAAKMVGGMVARGYEPDFAERCFKQIEGFGTYGFPESHAASFALLVYISAWLKCHHPACFACALLNSQPMGFYAPAQIVGDARDHGAVVRGVDVRDSRWDCTMEDGALRLGFRVVNGFQEAWSDALAAARASGLGSFDDLASAGLPRAALVALADADAMRSLGLDRRTALWLARGWRDDAALPLFARSPVRERAAFQMLLPPMTEGEHVIADYQSTRLSLKAHPLRFLRRHLQAEGVASCGEANNAPDGADVRVAGVVLVRQRPGNGNVVFCTIEDETGIANVVIWASLAERDRRALIGSSLLLVHGKAQRAWAGDKAGVVGKDIVHVVADRLEDRSAALSRISLEAGAAAAKVTAPADEMPARPRRAPAHPRSERVFPNSRDFH